MFGFLVFPMYNLLCNLMMTWVSTVYPIYRTVKVLNKKETFRYDNYLSFWFLAGIIFAFEWSRLPIVIYPIWFQLKMVAFLVLQWNNCEYSKLIYTRLTPLLDQHEHEIHRAGDKLKALSTQVKDGMFEQVSKQVSKHGPTLLSTGQQFVGEMLTVPKNMDAATKSSKTDSVNSDDLTIEELKAFRAFQKMQKSATAATGK